MNDMERRYTQGQVEVRTANDRKLISGYAIVFDRLSHNLGGWVERVAPTAVNRSRGNGWPGVVARYNHSDDYLLGTSGANTLQLSVDNVGLFYEVDPPQARNDIVELVARGDIRHSSFAFRVIGDDGQEWELSDQGFPMRTLHSVDLIDVAPVASPAYPDTTAGLRSFAEHFDASLDEVRKLADQDELRKFFVRTDNKGRLSGYQARAVILNKAN